MAAPLPLDKQLRLKAYADRVGFKQACKALKIAPATYAKAAGGFAIALAMSSHIDAHLPNDPPNTVA